MPKGFQAEGGFDNTTDITPTKKITKWEELLEENREKQKGVLQMLSEATASITSNKSTMGAPANVTFDYCQSRAKKYRTLLIQMKN